MHWRVIPMNYRDAAISFPFLGEDFVINPPTHITVFGRSIYWYGIIIGLGFLLAEMYALKRSKQFGLTQDNILDMLICAVPSAIIGARLYYVVFNPDEYFGAGKWGNVVKIWEGGLAIYGGIIFAVAATIIVCRVRKIPLLPMLDIGGLGLLIGQAVGRWGNFMNREAFGRTTEVFCRMGLTLPGQETIYVHPTFLYESIWNAVGFVILHFVSKKWRKFDGQIFIMYIGWYGLGRFFIEGLRTDSLYILGTDIRVSQLLAIICFGAAVILLLRSFITKRGNYPPLASSMAWTSAPVNNNGNDNSADLSISSTDAETAVSNIESTNIDKKE